MSKTNKIIIAVIVGILLGIIFIRLDIIFGFTKPDLEIGKTYTLADTTNPYAPFYDTITVIGIKHGYVLTNNH